MYGCKLRSSCVFITKVLEYFRADPKKTRYIGAICGLGIDQHTERPALPDNDIEIPFDVKIDLEDIYKVKLTCFNCFKMSCLLSYFLKRFQSISALEV